MLFNNKNMVCAREIEPLTSSASSQSILRMEYEGALYHVTTRGNERKKIYLNSAGV